MQKTPKQNVRRVTLFFLIVLMAYSVAAFAVMNFIILTPQDVAAMTPYQADHVYVSMQTHGAAAVLWAFLLLVIRRARKCPGWAPRGASLVAVLFMFFSADRMINAFDPPAFDRGDLFRLHPIRGWSHIPNRTTFHLTPVRTDQLGLRVHHEDPVRSINGGRRMLFSGDSVTFGYNQTAREAFCELTVDRLNAKYDSLKAIALNAGVTGYDTRQSLHLLAELGFALKPAAVVHQVCLNDFTAQFSFALDDRDRSPEWREAIASTHWSGLYRLFVRLGERAIFGGDEESRSAEIEHFEFKDLLLKPAQPRVQTACERVRRHLTDIVAECQARDVPVAVVVFPIWMQLDDVNLSDWPQQEIVRWCQSLDVPALDVTPVYRAYMKKHGVGTRDVYYDETHPSNLGHEIAAEAIARFLEDQGVIETLLARPIPAP